MSIAVWSGREKNVADFIGTIQHLLGGFLVGRLAGAPNVFPEVELLQRLPGRRYPKAAAVSSNRLPRIGLTASRRVGYCCQGEPTLSLYRVYFKWREKEVELTARSLDLTHPYFVSIKNLVFPTEEKLVINPSEEETRRFFGKSDHLMIPFQTVSLIEELPDAQNGKVMPFPLKGDSG